MSNFEITTAAIASGDDTILGGGAADTINGGKGDDVIDCGGGDDVIDAGAGNDVIAWDAGGNDVIDGGKGDDALLFTTSDESEIISILDFGGHAFVTGGCVLDLDNVERIAFGGSGLGADHFFIAQLGGTDVRQVDIALDTPGGDGQIDTVLITGEAGHDRIVIAGGQGSTTVSGLPAEINVSQGEAIDRIAVNALDGDDTFDLTGLAGGGATVRLDGGAGADRFVFGPSHGASVQISYFQPHGGDGDADLIVLRGFADHSFGEAAANGHIVQAGADVVVSDEAGAVVTLLNTSLSAIHASDFLFA